MPGYAIANPIYETGTQMAKTSTIHETAFNHYYQRHRILLYGRILRFTHTSV